LAFIESRNIRVVAVVIVVVEGCFIVDRDFGTSALLRRFGRGMPFGCVVDVCWCRDNVVVLWPQG
jgi:hypothetical protein